MNSAAPVIVGTLALAAVAVRYLLHHRAGRSSVGAAATDQRRFVVAPIPAPFDRLVVTGKPPREGQLQWQQGAVHFALWQESVATWNEAATVVVATHPYERVYRETAVLLSVEWPPTLDDRTLGLAAELVRRFYLEGRELLVGRVWQGYQLLGTGLPTLEARLPDDLPRTGADEAYEDLLRIVLVYRYTICWFRRTNDPVRLAANATLAQQLASELNDRLGPLAVTRT